MSVNTAKLHETASADPRTTHSSENEHKMVPLAYYNIERIQIRYRQSHIEHDWKELAVFFALSPSHTHIPYK